MKSIAKRIFVTLLAAFFCATPVSARSLHGSAASAPLNSTATLNIGPGDMGVQATTNLLHNSSINYVVGTNSPAATDQYGFPIANFSTLVIGGSLGTVSALLGTTGPYQYGWDAGRSCFKMNFLKSGTASSIVNATVGNGSGSGNLNVTGDCSHAGSITINWNDTTGISYQWDPSYTQYASNTSGKMWLARSGNVGWSGASDLTAYLSSGILWTKEAVDFIAGTKAVAIRPMGLNAINGQTAGSNVTNFSTRKTLNHFSFFAPDYPPGIRCGSLAGGAQTLCTATVSSGNITVAPATDSNLSGWTDGEQIIAQIPSSINGISVSNVANNGGNCQITVSDASNLFVGQAVFVNNLLNNGGSVNGCSTPSNTADTITAISGSNVTYNRAFAAGWTAQGWVSYQRLTVTGKPSSKLMVSVLGGPLLGDGSPYGAIQTGFETFTYNAVLDKVIATSSNVTNSQLGVSNAFPLEAQAQLANLVAQQQGSNIFKLWYNFPPWMTNSSITSTLNTLFSSLNSNVGLIVENCNEPWNTGQTCGPFYNQMADALGIGTLIDGRESFNFLKSRIMFGNLLPASSWSGSLSRVERFYNIRNSGSIGEFDPYFIGSTLISPGSAAYQAYVGGSAVNYNVSGGRPMDFMDSFGGAPYFAGGTALADQSPDALYTPTSFDVSFLNSLIAAKVGGNASLVNSLISGSMRGDTLNRTQTVTCSGTLLTTSSPHFFVQFDAVRFFASGGTACTGLDLNKTCIILAGSLTANTFTCQQPTNGAPGSAVNAGSAGSGTTSVGYLDNSEYASRTIFGIMNARFTQWQSYAAGLTPNPSHTIKVRWYEGNPEITPPTVSTCTSLGIASPAINCGPVDGGSILDLATTDYKHSTQGALDFRYYYDVFMGKVTGTLTNPSGTSLMLNSAGPAQLVLNCGGVYALNANCFYVRSGTNQANPYSWYDGYAASNQ